jgi:hypothetical protein
MSSFSPDIDALTRQLKGDIFRRWMRASQKQSLLEWRDRKTSPGLAARFVEDGAQYYRFSNRLYKTSRAKKFAPDYVKTGKLRDALLKRIPHAVNNGSDEIVTTFKYGGLAFNFPNMNIQGVLGENKSRVVESVHVSGYYRQNKGGTTSHINAFIQERHTTKHTVTRGGGTYAQQFAEFARDSVWLKNRTDVIMLAKVQNMSLKGGKLGTSYKTSSDGE